MNNTQTIEKLRGMRLPGMAVAFESILQTNADFTADEAIAQLVEAEWDDRQRRRIDRLMRNAKFRYQAAIEEVEANKQRNLDKQMVARLAECSFIEKSENIILTGSTGTGKSFLASAIGNQACLKGYRTLYAQSSKLFSKMKMSKADGTWDKEINKIAKYDLLIIDDFGLYPIDAQARLTLLEIIEDRHGQKSTLIASQIPVSGWHDLLVEQTIADAILDRLVHTAHRIELRGESMRRLKTKSRKK